MPPARHFRLDARVLTRAVGIALPVVIGIAAGRVLAPWIPQAVRIVEQLGVWGPVLYVLAYAAGVVLLLPVFLLIMVGGAVFGTALGAMLALAGALAGGTAAFLIARHVARDFVARRIATHPTLASLDRIIEEDGVKLVFLLRLSPTIPFVPTNYALGVTRVRTRDFVLGTLGLAPVVLLYAAYGSTSGGARGTGAMPLSPLALGLGVVATVVLGLLLARLVQRAIREAQVANGFTPSDIRS